VRTIEDVQSFGTCLFRKTAVALSGIAVLVVGSFFLIPWFDYDGLKMVFSGSREMAGYRSTILSAMSITAFGVKPYLEASALVIFVSGFVFPLKRWRDGNTDQIN
jgi:preprotein translocase subunit SecY